MADTIRGNFGDTPCSDCGERGGVYLKHWGPLVPPGDLGYFDQKCATERNADLNNGLPPRPLGTRTNPAAA